MAGPGLSVGHLHVVVVDDEVGVEPDPVDAAAARPDGDVVAQTGATAVGAAAETSKNFFSLSPMKMPKS